MERPPPRSDATDGPNTPTRDALDESDFVLINSDPVFSPLDLLSEDLIVRILSMLEPADLGRCAQLNSTFRRILCDKTFSKLFHERKAAQTGARLAAFRRALEQAATEVPEQWAERGALGGALVAEVGLAALTVTLALLSRGASSLNVPPGYGLQLGSRLGGWAGRSLGALYARQVLVADLEQQQHPLFLRDDERARACARCARPFTWFRWRYFCRSCGDPLCDDCLSERALIPQIGYASTEARVCARCCQELSTGRCRLALLGPELRALVACGRCCTWLSTGTVVACQNAYRCLDCPAIPLVCVSCVERCHAGHRTSARSEFLPFSCGCGASGKCLALEPLPQVAQLDEQVLEFAPLDDTAASPAPDLLALVAAADPAAVDALSDTQLEALFARLDVDGDGTVSAEDWQRWLASQLPPESPTPPLQDLQRVALVDFRVFLRRLLCAQRVARGGHAAHS